MKTALGEPGLWLLVAAGIVMSLILSEATSNTASANVMVPLMIAIAHESHLPVIPIAMATGLACSFGFMLPVSTGPNALAYATGHVPLPRMIIILCLGMTLPACADPLHIVIDLHFDISIDIGVVDPVPSATAKPVVESNDRTDDLDPTRLVANEFEDLRIAIRTRRNAFGLALWTVRKNRSRAGCRARPCRTNSRPPVNPWPVAAIICRATAVRFMCCASPECAKSSCGFATRLI